MKAIVCVKQVPDTQGKVAVKADGTMDRSAMATITNPDDLNAVEAALQLKDETGCEVVVVTMGPPPAEGMLRELMARGADRGVLVSGREFGGSDTFATSQILAAAVNKIGVGPEDIVFCGRQAIDGDTAQVGPQIAEKLHLPQVTYVTDIQKDGNSLTVKRQLEDGYMELKVQTPCLLTCIKELNTPRYMSVSGIFECYDKPLEVFDYNALKDDPLIEVDTIGLKGSPTNVFKSFTPPQKGAGTMLTGDDTAAQLHAQVVGQLAAFAQQLVADGLDLTFTLLAEYPHAFECGGVHCIEFSHCLFLLPQIRCLSFRMPTSWAASSTFMPAPLTGGAKDL